MAESFIPSITPGATPNFGGGGFGGGGFGDGGFNGLTSEGTSGAGIGAFKDIIPVTMGSNTPIDKPQPQPPDPEIGARWGSPSQFVLRNQNADPTGQGDPSPQPLYVKNSPTEEAKTRVESFSGPKKEIETYLIHNKGCDTVGCSEQMTEGEIIRVAYLSLGKETQKEIAGFTAYADGHVVERYKDTIWDRYVKIDSSGFPCPRRTGKIRIEGAIPPP